MICDFIRLLRLGADYRIVFMEYAEVGVEDVLEVGRGRRKVPEQTYGERLVLYFTFRRVD